MTSQEIHKAGLDCMNRGDYDGMVAHWEQSAALGNAVSARNLSMTYVGDAYGKKDKNKFFQWVTKAAELGDETAMVILGTIYCQNDRGHSIWVVPFGIDGFSGLVSGKTPQDGINLIKEAVATKPSLDFDDYTAIADAYHCFDPMNEATRITTLELAQTFSEIALEYLRTTPDQPCRDELMKNTKQTIECRKNQILSLKKAKTAFDNVVAFRDGGN
jgi:hypothetical protein